MKSRVTSKEQSEAVRNIANILETSEFTHAEKFRIRFIKIFFKRRMKKICKKLYGFSYRSEKKMFRRVIRNTYAEGIVLNNLADFHLMGITKCDIMDNDWRNFLTPKGKIK